MSEVAANIETVRAKVRAACQRSGRKEEAVKIVAVSKKQPVEKMNAYSAYCKEKSLPLIFGESYVQEFREKREIVSKPYEAHLIGALQSNKAKDAVLFFDVIESVHSEKLIAELDKQAGNIKKIQNILIQVNISNDPNKSGFESTEAKRIIIEALPSFKNLRLKGLMTITADYDNAEQARPDYKNLRLLRDEILSKNPDFKNGLALSMGMSHDYEIAVEEGADYLRIGTAIFGERL